MDARFWMCDFEKYCQKMLLLVKVSPLLGFATSMFMLRIPTRRGQRFKTDRVSQAVSVARS